MTDIGSEVTANKGSREASVMIGRRRLLTHVMAVPVLTVATQVLLSDAEAASAEVPLVTAIPSLPSVEELFDVGDALALASMPTMPLVTLAVGTDGVARLDLPRVELGQGLTTSVAMLIAEELDVSLDQVDVTIADARPELLFNQMTAGSSTLRTFYEPVRALAATARARLVAAAARRWDVPAASLRVRNGAVVSGDGRTATYGDLSAEASDVNLAGITVDPKPMSEHVVIGRGARRVDARDIVTGRKKFTMDVPVAGAKYALVRRPPTIKGTVQSVHNAAAVKAMSGIVGVVQLVDGVAVVADSFERARRGVNALDVTFGPGPIDGESNATISAKLHDRLPPLALPPLGALTVEGDFEWAAANHAPLETESAVADVQADRAEIWSGFQAPIVAQQEIAIALGLPQGAVTAHVVSPGGGFGRRVFFECAMEAALISQAMKMPIRLMWHRTEDMRYGRVRPQNVHRIRATVLAGQVISYEQRVSGVATDVAPGFGEIITDIATSLPPGAKQTAGEGGMSQTLFLLMLSSPYNFGAYIKTLTELGNGMPTAAYRSVPCPTARGCEEIIVDELAKKLGVDPVEFRRRVVKDDRSRIVLDKVAELSDWGKKMPPGFAQGVGFHRESKSYSACVVELDGRDPDDPHVTRATVVLDVGLPVNPLGLEAQMQGCLAEAVSLTLRAGLHLQNGLPLEGSYHNYHWVRQKEYPNDVAIHVLPANGAPIGGAGEVGISAPTGAIANAYATATGRKPRHFPLVFPIDFEIYPPGYVPGPPYLNESYAG